MSWDFQPGDEVIVYKPEDVRESPRWIRKMDEYNGKSAIINGKTSLGNYKLKFKSSDGEWKESGYSFSPKWIEFREDEIKCGDVSELMWG